MMTCKELAELLIDFVTGDLAPEHCALIQQHLHGCPPCVIYIETYRLTIQLTRKLPDRPVPESLIRRLREAAAQLEQEG